MSFSQDLSIVIATRNRAEQLSQTLSRLQALEERPRLYVMDNGSTDGTAEIVRRDFPDVVLVELGGNCGARARNLGVQMATTPLVAFSDDDSWWAAGSLSQALSLFHNHPRLGLIAAQVRVGPQRKLDPVSEAMRKSPLPRALALPGPQVLGFLACGAVVRRAAFLEVSGFHEKYLIGGEEKLIAIDLSAAGWHVCYVDRVVAFHHPLPGQSRSDRKVVMVRNDLWTTWLRRPLPIVISQTGQVLLDAIFEEEKRRGLFAAFKGLPWVLQERRLLPATVECNLCLLGI